MLLTTQELKKQNFVRDLDYKDEEMYVKFVKSKDGTAEVIVYRDYTRIYTKHRTWARSQPAKETRVKCGFDNNFDNLVEAIAEVIGKDYIKLLFNADIDEDGNIVR